MKRRVVNVADILEVKGAAVLTIKPTETIAALSRRLQQEQVGAMIVSQDGQSVDGIISERDVAYGLALHRGDLHALPVEALMTKKVITCSPEDKLSDIVKVMRERRIRHLPVTDGARLVGLIGMRDVFMHRLEEMQRVAKLVCSAEFEQYAVATTRVAPLDIPRGLGDDAAGSAFDTAVGRDLDLAPVIELIAARRAGREKGAQCRRRHRVGGDLDVDASRVDEIAVLKKLVLDADRERGCHPGLHIGWLVL
jgi:CBS domain-containing protein